MKIVVIGGTGLIGSKLVSRLLALDHLVIAASPSSGVDTITGEGLTTALKDADVVVDVSNSPSLEDDAALDFFTRSTSNLLAVEIYERVKHHIAISVVGADRLPGSGYLRAKVAQENMIRESGVPYSILRSTQFFEFAERIARAGAVGEEIHISPARFQPISSDDVIDALTDIVLGMPLNNTVEVAGPVAMPMNEFIRYYLDATEDSRQVIADEQALYFGATLNDSSLIPGKKPRLGKTTYEHWFSTQSVHS